MPVKSAKAGTTPKELDRPCRILRPSDVSLVADMTPLDLDHVRGVAFISDGSITRHANGSDCSVVVRSVVKGNYRRIGHLGPFQSGHRGSDA